MPVINVFDVTDIKPKDFNKNKVLKFVFTLVTHSVKYRGMTD